MAHTRINILSVPVDVVQPNELQDEIMDIIMSGEVSQVCFVSIWDILKARINAEHLSCLKKAALVLPISKTIITAANFLKLPVPVRYNPFSAIITILGALDKNYRSLYLLGGRKSSLMITEKNIHSTFPGIQIVGRYVGYYSKSMESNLIQAIHKSSPSMVLLSDGVQKESVWAYKRRELFNTSLFIYYKDAFSIFSKRKKRVSSETFDKGLEIWSEIARNPFKIVLIFPYLWFLILLLWYRCFRT